MGWPVNALGQAYNIGRGFQADRRWDRAYEEQVLPANEFGEEAVTALGPIGQTTTMASDLYGRARGLAGGLSDQANIDTNQRFDQFGASLQAGLRARGIGGSTVGPSLALANERNRGAELRLNNDARINTLLGVEETFGGGEIAASEEAARLRLQQARDRYIALPGAPTPFVPAPR
jgi:hypothetical protein